MQVCTQDRPESWITHSIWFWKQSPLNICAYDSSRVSRSLLQGSRAEMQYRCLYYSRATETQFVFFASCRLSSPILCYPLLSLSPRCIRPLSRSLVFTSCWIISESNQDSVILNVWHLESDLSLPTDDDQRKCDNEQEGTKQKLYLTIAQ
jgi:hypothetical protein